MIDLRYMSVYSPLRLQATTW